MKKGDKVEAKWSGSKMYYTATVLKKTAKHIEVEFEDGTVETVKPTDVKPVELSKRGRPTRSRSRSLGRSSTRSTSRSPVRKIPTKPEKKPTLTKSKSESKLKPEAKVKKESKSKTPDLKAKTVDTRAKTPDIRSKTPDVKAKPLLTRSKINHANVLVKESTPTVQLIDINSGKTHLGNSRSEKVIYSEVSSHEFQVSQSDAPMVRSSARIAALQTARNLAEKFDALRERSKSRGYSDEEEDESNSDDVDGFGEGRRAKRFSFVSFAAALFKTLLPVAMILFLFHACYKTSCSVYTIPPFRMRWSSFQESVKYPLLACFLFHALLTVLSKIPLKSKVRGFESIPRGKFPKTYQMNGVYLLLLAAATFGGLFYYGIDVNWGFNKMKAIVYASLIYTFFWSLVMHCYGLLKKEDSEEEKPVHTAGFFGNFYYGLEINPRLFGIEDIKTRFIQFGLIGLVLLDLSILTKMFMSDKFVVPLGITVGMHILFVIDYFLREENMLSTPTYTDEGVGCGFIMGVGCILPCSFALQTYFLAAFHTKITHMPYWCYGAIVALFLFGFYIYNSSGRLKHNFRINPFAPPLQKFTSIPTSKKKRLMTSGLFGLVRHPNYLGLILMATAWSLPCGFTNILPYCPLFYLVLLLVFRIVKIEGVCRAKYGPAWQNYKELVPKRLIPYVI